MGKNGRNSALRERKEGLFSLSLKEKRGTRSRRKRGDEGEKNDKPLSFKKCGLAKKSRTRGGDEICEKGGRQKVLERRFK